MDVNVGLNRRITNPSMPRRNINVKKCYVSLPFLVGATRKVIETKMEGGNEILGDPPGLARQRSDDDVLVPSPVLPTCDRPITTTEKIASTKDRHLLRR